MKIQKILIPGVVFGVIFLCLIFSPLLSIASKNQSMENSGRGAAVDGLQMSVSLAEKGKTGVPEFQIALQNIGEQDVTLNLGMMLANGKVQLPEKISLNVTDASGKTRSFKFFNPKYAAIAGRVDDYVVPLRAGSTYTLVIPFDYFWSLSANQTVSQLPPGKYKITAQFEGRGAEIAGNSDIKLMNFWKGEAQSNALTFER